MKRGDLHTHSSASDGKLTPEALLAYAAERGLAAVALTDHDSLDGLAAAERAAAERGVAFIPGVEVTAEWGGREAHILGYFVDRDSEVLRDRLAEQRRRRESRGEDTVRLLQSAGCALSWARVQEISGAASVGRPHIARALVEAGYATGINEAFVTYLGVGAPAYIPAPAVPAAEAIALIRSAGGLAALAHPLGLIETAPEWRSLGLGGLEVYYAAYSADEIISLSTLAGEYGLLRTGGSDFHGLGNPEGTDLGSADVPWEHVQRLFEWQKPRVP